MRIRTGLIALVMTGIGSAQALSQTRGQPWQVLQMPTAAGVAAAWKNVPSEYGPEPYYSLNGPVTIDVIRRDLDNMLASGWRAVTVQYGAGGGFDYMSPQYLNLFRAFVLEARKRGMKVWIVDDAGYPSGFAGGKFTSEHPELRMQILMAARTVTVEGRQSIDEAIPTGTVAISAIPSLSGDAISLPMTGSRLKWTAPAGSWTVVFVAHTFRTSPTRSATNPTHAKDETQSLEDYLDPAATRQYLDFTHNAYRKVIGDEFGKTVMGFRGDEPDYTIAGLPWTPRFFDTFQKMKGYDIRPYLAVFLQPKGPETRLSPRQLGAKADFYDVFARMFEDGFFKPQAVWCAQNHMEYQVHINHEEQQLHLVQSEGDFFRAMRYVQVPGIDAIWHQIWTDTVSDFPRLASSVSHVYGHPRAFTESFAAYRPMPDIAMARYIINEQLVRGINLVETMHYSASATPNGGPLAFMKDPGWPGLMAYTRRASYLMAMGRPDAHVALLLPTAAMWMQDAAADDTFVSSERLLSEHQVDFDAVTEDAINETLKPGPGTLETASGNRYRTVIVPNASVLSQATIDRLKAFAAGGGHVLFITGPPGHIARNTYLDMTDAKPSDFGWAAIVNEPLPPVPTPPAFPPASAPGPLAPPAPVTAALDAAVADRDAALASPDTAIRLMRRRLEDATVFMLFNESDHAVRNTLVLRSAGGHVERWDPETGNVSPVAGDAGRIALDFKPYEAAFYVVSGPADRR
ncbi:MAG TPA: glycosyl hydrolase [Rhizomicrobium sp.]|nr:glycosyl hydrolase [Rhizomicrobium sp.]